MRRTARNCVGILLNYVITASKENCSICAHLFLVPLCRSESEETREWGVRENTIEREFEIKVVVTERQLDARFSWCTSIYMSLLRAYYGCECIHTRKPRFFGTRLRNS